MRPAEAHLLSVAAIRGSVAAIDAWMRGEIDCNTFTDVLEREGPRVAITATAYTLLWVLEGLAGGTFNTTREQLWAQLLPHINLSLDDHETVARLFDDDD